MWLQVPENKPFHFSPYRQAIKARKPDVVILFLHLKDRIFLPLLHWLKWNRIPVIVWSKGRNLDDLDTDIAYTKEKNMHRFHVNTHLVDADQQTPVQGAIPVTLDYVYSQQGLSIEMEHCPLTACLVLPVIAAPSEVADITPEGMRLQKKDGVLEVVCVNGRMKVAPTDKDGRIFNPVPGFSFIPLQVFPDSPDKKIQVKIMYN